MTFWYITVWVYNISIESGSFHFTYLLLLWWTYTWQIINNSTIHSRLPNLVVNQQARTHAYYNESPVHCKLVIYTIHLYIVLVGVVTGLKNIIHFIRINPLIIMLKCVCPSNKWYQTAIRTSCTVVSRNSFQKQWPSPMLRRNEDHKSRMTNYYALLLKCFNLDLKA